MVGNIAVETQKSPGKPYKTRLSAFFTGDSIAEGEKEGMEQGDSVAPQFPNAAFGDCVMRQRNTAVVLNCDGRERDVGVAVTRWGQLPNMTRRKRLSAKAK